VIGTIAISDIVRSYRRALQASLRRASEVGGATGMLDVTIMKDAALADATLRAAQVPRGVLVTAIERGKEVIPPNGDTVDPATG